MKVRGTLKWLKQPCDAAKAAQNSYCATLERNFVSLRSYRRGVLIEEVAGIP